MGNVVNRVALGVGIHRTAERDFALRSHDLHIAGVDRQILRFEDPLANFGRPIYVRLVFILIDRRFAPGLVLR